MLVRLQATALNHRDIFIQQGLYPRIKLPVIIGSDGAGVVEAVGDGVDSGWVGQAVLLNPAINWEIILLSMGRIFRFWECLVMVRLPNT